MAKTRSLGRTPTLAPRSRPTATSRECFRKPGPSAATASTNSASSMRGGVCFTTTTLRLPPVAMSPKTFPVYAYFGREPYSFIQRIEKRYQFTDNFSWTIGRHNTKFGVDFNYIPLTATFTVNYGGLYNFGSTDPATLRVQQLVLRKRVARCFLSYLPRLHADTELRAWFPQ